MDNNNNNNNNNTKAVSCISNYSLIDLELEEEERTRMISSDGTVGCARVRSCQDFENIHRVQQSHENLLDSLIDYYMKLLKKRKTQLDSHGSLLNGIVSAVILRSLWDSSSKEGGIRRIRFQIEYLMTKRAIFLLRQFKNKIEMNKEDSKDILRDLSLQEIELVLKNDTIFRILSKKSKWLIKLAEFKVESDNFKADSKKEDKAIPNKILSFLDILKNCNNPVKELSTTDDLPSTLIANFEILLLEHKFYKSEVGVSLCKLITEELDKASKHLCNTLYKTESSTLFKEFHTSINNYIIEEFSIPTTHHEVLHICIHFMLFSRLSVLCYLPQVDELDKSNQIWNENILKFKKCPLSRMGLPQINNEKIQKKVSNPYESLFPQSINLFSSLSQLIPYKLLNEMMEGIRCIHTEAAEIFQIPATSVSADYLLPILVYVLSRSDVPCIQSQLYLLDKYSSEYTSSGCESSYYLACVHSAVGYVMETEIDS